MALRLRILEIIVISTSFDASFPDDHGEYHPKTLYHLKLLWSYLF